MRNEDCFAREQQWQNVEFTDFIRGHTKYMMDFLVRRIVNLPSLLKNVRAFNTRPYLVDSKSIFQQACNLRQSLEPVAEFVNSELNINTEITNVPPLYIDGPVESVYRFSSQALANVCVFYWG